MSKKDLKQLEKAAKVNTGAETLVSILGKVNKGSLSKEQAQLISQSVLDKIKLEVPVLVFTDVSSSMSWDGVNIEGNSFTPLELAAIALTAFLLKNPLSELQSIFGVFSSESDIITDYKYYSSGNKKNKYVYSESTLKKGNLIVDKTKSFVENLNNIKKILTSYDYGSTNINSIPTMLKKWVDSEKQLINERKEQIQKYPVILVISDGDLNNMYSPSQSLLEFQSNMRQWFGWEGLTVIWDVKKESKGDGKKFEGIENCMYFGNANVGVLNQIFTNLHDLDIVDVYLPLEAIHRSNRYQPVRDLVQNKALKNKELKELV